MSIRVGHGFDAHRLAAGRRFVLAGITVADDFGPLGHSDADVVAHAICDALLGAAALGDLGTHFPDSDLRWKDADSMVLLARCTKLLAASGWGVENIDATIVVQNPRLSQYLPAMRAEVARVVQIDVNCVSVKAKTSEGMGYTGDGTGIAAYAVALIESMR